MKPVFKLTKAESKLAELLWSNAPIASMEMVKMALSEFGWKKSTTFTNLKFLIEKGLARNEKSCVTMLFSKDEFIAEQSCDYIDDAFSGSLPMFVASFTSRRKLSAEQVAELKRLIGAYVWILVAVSLTAALSIGLVLNRADSAPRPPTAPVAYLAPVVTQSTSNLSGLVRVDVEKNEVVTVTYSTTSTTIIHTP